MVGFWRRREVAANVAFFMDMFMSAPLHLLSCVSSKVDHQAPAGLARLSAPRRALWTRCGERWGSSSSCRASCSRIRMEGSRWVRGRWLPAHGKPPAPHHAQGKPPAMPPPFTPHRHTALTPPRLAPHAPAALPSGAAQASTQLHPPPCVARQPVVPSQAFPLARAQGINVRQRAGEVVALLNNPGRITQERQKVRTRPPPALHAWVCGPRRRNATAEGQIVKGLTI